MEALVRASAQPTQLAGTIDFDMHGHFSFVSA